MKSCGSTSGQTQQTSLQSPRNALALLTPVCTPRDGRCSQPCHHSLQPGESRPHQTALTRNIPELEPNSSSGLASWEKPPCVSITANEQLARSSPPETLTSTPALLKAESKALSPQRRGTLGQLPLLLVADSAQKCCTKVPGFAPGTDTFHKEGSALITNVTLISLFHHTKLSCFRIFQDCLQ